ncbi:MAG: NAD(P)H-dependent oxidoreductase [Spirochaetia bacterium]|jgi:NAD(P)H dehydrogenase (quinone)|nr:NAD(P)H-dependent oxidoreductase [Spirochaetia bacterium]
MKFLIIMAHPDKRSFNSSIAKTIRDYIIKSGNGVILHDLYEENFNPILSAEEINRKFSFDENIQRYSIELSEADHIIFIHPDWWGQMPAILKGWLDRVFRQGTAFEYDGPDFEDKEKIALLTGKLATVIITTDRDPEIMLIEKIWQKDILSYCGIDDAGVLIHFKARTSGSKERDLFIERIISRTNSIAKS